jgi:hypothetical protein
MSHRPTELERAFTLARSGDYEGLDAVRKQLKAEGYSGHQIEGPTLVRQLRELCLASKRGCAADPT